MLAALMDCLRRRRATMKQKLEDAESAISAMEAGSTDPKPTLPRTLSIRIPRTASCERCHDVRVVTPEQAATPDWECDSCVVGGAGRPRCPRVCQFTADAAHAR